VFAVCCSVLQCVAVCVAVISMTAASQLPQGGVVQGLTVCCNVLFACVAVSRQKLCNIQRNIAKDAVAAKSKIAHMYIYIYILAKSSQNILTHIY